LTRTAFCPKDGVGTASETSVNKIKNCFFISPPFEVLSARLTVPLFVACEQILLTNFWKALSSNLNLPPDFEEQ